MNENVRMYIYSGKKKPCLGYCVSTGVRMLKALGYQVDNTEDGVALRGEVCNIPKFSSKFYLPKL